jgi:hypothetical protein
LNTGVSERIGVRFLYSPLIKNKLQKENKMTSGTNFLKNSGKLSTPPKPKMNQKETLDSVQIRDCFQTPNYGTKLIVPFIERLVGKKKNFTIWECASGLGKMAKVLTESGFNVISTDLETGFNFLTDKPDFDFDCIITNTPFSLKRKFYMKGLEYNVPFAYLLPADYCGWIIDAIKNGAEKIIPTRRIDYITPNILHNVMRGETWETQPELRLEYEKSKNVPIEKLNKKYLYKDIYSCPTSLLAKYSSSYFHSLWFTVGFNIGKSESIVELSNKMKEDI